MANAADSFQWNTGNVFDEWDLNPLAQKVGGGADGVRDMLSDKRDAFLSPYMQQYRGAVGPAGSADDDYGLFNDAGFRSYVQNGQLPQQQQAPQQAQAAVAGGSVPQNQARNTELYDMLRARAQQGLNVSAQDPALRAQADAYSANEQRASRNYLADVAEKSGPNANLRGEQRMAAERTGQRTGAFEADLVGREISARRQEIAQSLESMRGLLTADEQMALQRELALLDDAARDKGMGLQQQQMAQQNDQFMRELALREWDNANKWNYTYGQGGF